MITTKEDTMAELQSMYRVHEMVKLSFIFFAFKSKVS